MITVKETLIRARELIADPTRWTRRAMARNAVGYSIEANDANAVCFCSMGAIHHVLREESRSFWSATDHLANHMDGSVAWFNDNHTHEEVLAKFDEAITSC